VPDPPPFDTVDVMNIPISNMSVRGVLDYVGHAIKDYRVDSSVHSPVAIGYVNAHSCNLAIEDPEYRRALLEMDLLYLDGNGPRLAAWMNRSRLQPRITAADWIDEFAAYCQRNRFSLFFLGGRPGVADEAAIILRQRHPGLNVLGHHHGYFDEATGDQIIDQITLVTPDILVLAMGSPEQERWAQRHRRSLDVAVIWASGGVLDYVSGRSRRPPRFMRKLGLEWLGRLILEPRRLWRRYLIGVPLFMWRAVTFAARQRRTASNQQAPGEPSSEIAPGEQADHSAGH
jgi:N-acetylglucosaminyldiphosphoundecaprenol N-acetyl-beta-D-mannosaminyltransferase